MIGLRCFLVVAAGFVGLLAQPSWSQDQPAVPGVSAIVTIDQDRLYANSLWGKRVTAELEVASRALQSENREIEATLTAEEKSLTEQRKTLTIEAFRKLADEFDSRVTKIRQTQEAKARDLTQRHDSDRQSFFDVALTAMGEVMSDHGAVAILDSRAIFLSVTSIDVTDEVIARVDERIGAGPQKP